MDADDLSLPERFARQFAFLSDHPEIAMVGTAFHTFRVRPGGADLELVNTVTPATDPAEVYWSLRFDNTFGHPSVMYKREVACSLGGYHDRVAAEDYHLWVRMSENHRLANLADPLVLYRTHDEQSMLRLSSTISRSATWIRWLAVNQTLGVRLSMNVGDWWTRANLGQPLDSLEAVDVVGSVLLHLAASTEAHCHRIRVDSSKIRNLAQHRLLYLHRANARRFPDAVQRLVHGRVLPLDTLTGRRSADGVQRLRLDGLRGRAFLHLPQWKTNTWRDVVMAYARAFTSSDDVTLVLWLDPSQGVSALEVQELVHQALLATGLESDVVPDLLLVQDQLAAAELPRLFAAVDCAVPNGDPIQADWARDCGVPILADLDRQAWLGLARAAVVRQAA
jgi:hypothetical protein